MKKFNVIQTPNNTQMVEIDLQEAQDIRLSRDDFLHALYVLYGGEVEILEMIENNLHASLQDDITYDYVIKVRTNSLIKYAYNFACCFIDSDEAQKLTADNELENIKEALKILRKERYSTHPLYYNDYADSILLKFRDAKEILGRQDERD